MKNALNTVVDWRMTGIGSGQVGSGHYIRLVRYSIIESVRAGTSKCLLGMAGVRCVDHNHVFSSCAKIDCNGWTHQGPVGATTSGLLPPPWKTLGIVAVRLIIWKHRRTTYHTLGTNPKWSCHVGKQSKMTGPTSYGWTERHRRLPYVFSWWTMTV